MPLELFVYNKFSINQTDWGKVPDGISENPVYKMVEISLYKLTLIAL